MRESIIAIIELPSKSGRPTAETDPPNRWPDAPAERVSGQICFTSKTDGSPPRRAVLSVAAPAEVGAMMLGRRLFPLRNTRRHVRRARLASGRVQRDGLAPVHEERDRRVDLRHQRRRHARTDREARFQGSCPPSIFSTTRSLALRRRGLRGVSSSDATIAARSVPRPRCAHLPCATSDAKMFLTMRSLERMERDHGQPAARLQMGDDALQAARQGLELLIHRDPQGLERARRRMVAGPRNDGLHDPAASSDVLVSGFFAALDDGAGDAFRGGFLAELRQKHRDLLGRPAIDDLLRGQRSSPAPCACRGAPRA